MKLLSVTDIDRIVEMALEDRTPFEAIASQFGLSDKDVIALMRSQLTQKSFERWRKRTKGRVTKHKALSNPSTSRFKSSAQRQISSNKISKR